ncbi:MAG TPA: hypothetical protein VKV57_00805 [bacterium]|nr:hypothetical protein [bacterium]
MLPLLAVVAAVLISVFYPLAHSRGAVVRLSSPFHVEVAGAPTPVHTLRLAIEMAAHIAFPQLEDAEIVLAGTQPVLSPLSPGRSVTVLTKLDITTSEGAPLIWVVPVTLTNTPAVGRDAQRLLVSDSPETVSDDGILDAGTLGASQTARILYHHQNGRTDRNMWLILTLVNPTPSPVRLLIVGATGGPHPDELRAGHTAARGFLEQYWARAGVFLQLPPNGIIPLLATRVPPNDVASGLAQIAVLEGSGVEVQLAAQFPRRGEPPVFSRILPLDTQHQRGVVGPPVVARSFSYAVGGPEPMMWVGANEDLLRDEVSGEPLHGNYGVIYTFDVQLTNPTAHPTTVALAIHANSGLAGATLLVNGALLDIPSVGPGPPRTVTTVHLPPTANGHLRISTMSEGGANYPVLFTVGPP